MGKIITTAFLVITILFLVKPVWAEKVAGSSATILASNNLESGSINVQHELYLKKKVIKTMMERYNSPMTESIDAFVLTCGKYNLNCYLLPSIAILESTFGQFIYPGSYNPFGWGGGYIMFKSWDEGIDAVAKGLRLNYVNKGAETIEQIAPIYSESPTWSPRVKAIQAQFEKLEQEMQLYLQSDRVEL